MRAQREPPALPGDVKDIRKETLRDEFIRQGRRRRAYPPEERCMQEPRGVKGGICLKSWPKV